MQMDMPVMVKIFYFKPLTVTICFTDVDECLTDNGGCDHFCHNYYGGHECSCRPGYTLQDDGRECVGKRCQLIWQ